MAEILVESLKEGQRFTEAVYTDGSNLLVPAGLPIKQKDIARLKSWGIQSVHSAGTAISDRAPTAEEAATPVVEPIENSPKVDEKKPKPVKSAKKILPKVLSLPAVQENKGPYRVYMDLIDRLNLIFESFGMGSTVAARDIETIGGRLVQAVRESSNSFVGFVLGGEVYGSELAKSSVNTAILAFLMAQDMRVPNHKTLQIVTAALLHDVGMLRLPKEILDSKGELNDGEAQRMKSHPLYTYRFICRDLLFPEEIGLIALQHHERWDGEGYPRRLSGNDIELGARIISVADAFEAMVSEKPYRNSMLGYQAMKNLLSDNSRRFDPEVLKSFIRTMGIYPIGSIVLLNTGALARVINVQGNAPLRPQLRVLIDEFGKSWNNDDGEMLDLLIEKSIFIARAIDPREYAKSKEA